jgi:hypothetical protein
VKGRILAGWAQKFPNPAIKMDRIASQAGQGLALICG